MSIPENSSTYNIENMIVFEVSKISQAHSENCIWSILPMRMLVLVDLDIFDTRCRPCPTESGCGSPSNEQISKNRIQIRNLHILKYRAPCCQVLVFNFIMSKKLIEGVPAINPGDPPDFPRRGSWKRKPEESASHHFWEHRPMASLQSRDGCEALSLAF